MADHEIMVIVDRVVPGLNIIALGGFESLHRGHRRLLSRVAHRPDGGVLTFQPLPKEALGYSTSRVLLEDERECGLQALGVEFVVSLPFATIKNMVPLDFLDRHLSGVQTIVVGENFRFGKGATGDVDLLHRWCKDHGKTLIVEPLEQMGQAAISTRIIKDLIHQGDVFHASELLGYPYFIKGTRCKGHSRGSRLGIPTINLRWNVHKTKPAYGVYDGFVVTKDTWAAVVASFGKAPTFGRDQVFLELHVPGHEFVVEEGDVVLFAFHRFLRPEMRFDTVDALLSQIKSDIAVMKKETAAIAEQRRYLEASFNSSCLLACK